MIAVGAMAGIVALLNQYVVANGFQKQPGLGRQAHDDDRGSQHGGGQAASHARAHLTARDRAYGDQQRHVPVDRGHSDEQDCGDAVDDGREHVLEAVQALDVVRDEDREQGDDDAHLAEQDAVPVGGVEGGDQHIARESLGAFLANGVAIESGEPLLEQSESFAAAPQASTKWV